MDGRLKGIKEFLTAQKNNASLRQFMPINNKKGSALYSDGRPVVDFGSNDYLGLSSQEGLFKTVINEAQTGDFGATASRLISGNRLVFEEVERSIAQFRGRPYALLFNSGYIANMSVIQALAALGAIFFVDRSAHASIYDGLLLAGARFVRFRHNDVEDLKRKISANRNKAKNAVVITEALFSMDGDSPDLNKMHRIAKHYDSLLYVDEAHSVGVFDLPGIGSADILLGTFGKAFAAAGAYIAVKDAGIRDYLINRCRGLIFTTAMPPIIAKFILKAIDFVQSQGEPLRQRLNENARFLRDRLCDGGIEARGERYIVPIVLYDNERATKFAARLLENGFYAPAIRPPTVPKGESRLRVSITAAHNTIELQEFAEALIHLMNT